ncbi:serine/threonine-protein kinase [Streptomyces phaeofaciens JCM 4814]|uniref:Serine/threonine protein kinase n=1 Tax=Streptomyces phaeofaciens TaxID=68254 RepID=A0A918LP65_9ACTN|nr:serine/threonine-protein kinase [Streptomyces phaeofaciens]GGT31768.1 serine/threonine protein kinase [Streptomyces phaeofaciens]
MNDATEVFQPLQADDPHVVAGYRLAARLGAGGMGRVYLSHTPGGRPVAIKVVRPELADDPDFRRRFGREIKAARRVRGAYTAELIDADADGVPPWLATLYVPGPSLSEAVARRGPLPESAVLWLMAGVAEALQAIHAAGIVHRDLKPSNVLLAADGPRVIDFGISLAADVTAHTATGSAIGTPQFMAPEQAIAGEVTSATDIFALGQTAAFAALGEPLYGDGPSVSVLYRIVHERPDLSVLPARLQPLIARCLAADPAERATLAEVLQWCREGLGGDADAGAGPAVWREVTGPEVTIPAPAAPAAAAPVPDPTSVHTVALLARPRPAASDGAGRPRRRRAALITAGVTAGALVLAGLTWTVMDATDLLRDRDAGASSTRGSSPSAPSASAPSASASASSASASSSGSASASGTGGGTPKASNPSASASPQAEANAVQLLDEKSSLSFENPARREDRKGDVRFVCGDYDCSLESDTSVITQLGGDPGATLDTCRVQLTGVTSHDLTLATAAAGSEVCVKNPAGDIALLVIRIKSTAVPDGGASFVMADVTIWRAA